MSQRRGRYSVAKGSADTCTVGVLDKKEYVSLCLTSSLIPRDGGPLVGREADDSAAEGGGHFS